MIHLPQNVNDYLAVKKVNQFIHKKVQKASLFSTYRQNIFPAFCFEINSNLCSILVISLVYKTPLSDGVNHKSDIIFFAGISLQNGRILIPSYRDR